MGQYLLDSELWYKPHYALLQKVNTAIGGGPGNITVC